MATEYLLDVDPVARAWNTIEIDGDQIIIRRYWESDDVDRLLRANAEQRLDGARGDPELQHVARIPDIVQYEWLHKLGVNTLDQNHQKEVNRLLSSREYYKLRTGGGRL
jgi:hypothetical protein